LSHSWLVGLPIVISFRHSARRHSDTHPTFSVAMSCQYCFYDLLCTQTNDPLSKHPWFFGSLNREVAKNKVVALKKVRTTNLFRWDEANETPYWLIVS